MSSHSDEQKTAELSCMQLALNEIKKQHGESKRILKLLAGVDVERDEEERPDFIRKTMPVNPKEPTTILGVEHFRVDLFSLEKSGKNGKKKIASKGICLNKNQINTYEKWNKKLDENHELPDQYTEEAAKDIINLVTEYMSNMYGSNYGDLLESLKYSIQMHNGSVSQYYENMKRVSEKGEEIRLAFLIELHAEMFPYILCDRKGVRRCKRNDIPLTEDVVDIIEKNIDSDSVQYIVLCMGDTTYTLPIKVIACTTKGLRYKIKKQHIPVYKYISYDQSVPPFKGKVYNMEFELDSISKSADNKQIDTTMTAHIQHPDPSTAQTLLFNSAWRILRCERAGIPFITTPLELAVAKALEPEVIGWKQDSNVKGKVIPIFADRDVKKAIQGINTRLELMKKEFDEAANMDVESEQ